MEAVNVSTRIPDFQKWLEHNLGIRFEFITTLQHPCCKFNDHDPRFPDAHVNGYARYDPLGKDTHEIWARNDASEALRVIAHEAVELTWMRDKKRADPKSPIGIAQDFVIDKEGRKLVNAYLTKPSMTWMKTPRKCPLSDRIQTRFRGRDDSSACTRLVDH